MSNEQSRRRFLRLSAIASAASLGSGWYAAGPVRADEQSIALKAARDQDLYRVRMELSLQGNIHLPKDPIKSKVHDRTLPLKASSVIDFEEQLTRNAKQVPQASRRYYYEAQGESKVGNQSMQSELRDDAKRVLTRLSNGPEIIYSDFAYLTHEELDLLQTPVSSLALDRLLPPGNIREGSAWDFDTMDLARLLNLDAVQKSTVSGEVISITDEATKMQLKGRFDGSAEGVPTAIDLAGKVTFDRASGSITWVALALREKRQIGVAKPGFEIAATVKLLRQPLDKPNAIHDKQPIDIQTAIPSERMLVKVVSPRQAFDAFLDRNWQMITDVPGQTTLRLIDNDTAVAQCDLRPLSDMKPGQQLTLEAYQVEIKKSLGNQFGEFIEAEEGLNGGELRTLRVAVVGQVENVPVQWVFLHFSDDFGRRLGATLSLESAHVEAFAGSDAQLANSLHFVSKSDAETASADSPSSSR